LQSGVTRFEFFVEGSEELLTLVAFDCTTFSRVPVVGLTLLGPDPTSTRDAVHLNTDALRCLRSRTIHPSAHVRFSLTCSEIGAFDVRLSIGDELVHEARVVSSTLLLERTVRLPITAPSLYSLNLSIIPVGDAPPMHQHYRFGVTSAPFLSSAGPANSVVAACAAAESSTFHAQRESTSAFAAWSTEVSPFLATLMEVLREGGLSDCGELLVIDVGANEPEFCHVASKNSSVAKLFGRSPASELSAALGGNSPLSLTSCLTTLLRNRCSADSGMRLFGFDADPQNFDGGMQQTLSWTGAEGNPRGSGGQKGTSMQYVEMAGAFEMSNIAVASQDNQTLVMDLLWAVFVPQPTGELADRHWGAIAEGDVGKAVDSGGACGGESERACNEMAVVPVRSLDGMASQGKFGHPSTLHINLLKVDVEGFEPDVLLGAWKLLEAHQIDVVHFECSHQWPASKLGWTLRSTTERLSAIGYDVFLLGGAGHILLNGPFWRPEYELGKLDRSVRLFDNGVCNCLAVSFAWPGAAQFMAKINSRSHNVWATGSWVRSGAQSKRIQ
jgi:hypothetical protein